MKKSKKKKSVQKWESLHVSARYDINFKEIGKMGWELVSVIPESSHIHFREYYYKRPMK